MSVLCGWASIGENGKASGGKSGDQKQTVASGSNDYKGEVKLGDWYDFNQTAAYRWNDEKLASEFAKAIKSLCNNKHVGYDQSGRVSLFNELKSLKWDYTKLTNNCECDCSELIACAVNCVLKKAAVSSSVYTGNIGSALVATGKLHKLKGTKYTSSSKYVRKGDIHNAPGHHVIAILEDGPNPTSSSTSDSIKVPDPTLKKGSDGTAVKNLQKCLNHLKIKDASGNALVVDGLFGSSTKEAMKKFQDKYGLSIDGIYGPKSASKMKSLIK